MLTKSRHFLPPKFYCENCDYGSSKKSDFNKHLTTLKHQKLANDDKKSPKVATLECSECGKVYSSRQSLHVHKKKCTGKLEEEKVDYQEMVIKLVQDNNELKNMISQVINNSNSTQINTTNNSFNLNFFLNETCKNAMNLSDFVDSLKLQFHELEQLGEIGYINGMSNLIVSNLNKLDISRRPMHCTDRKRETLYVKDENKWEKEDKEKPKIKNVIKKLSQQHINLILEYQKQYPNYLSTNSIENHKYNELIQELFGHDEKDVEKIIKKISKEIKIGENEL